MGILEWPFSAKASQHAETPLSCGMLMYREETSNGYLVQVSAENLECPGCMRNRGGLWNMRFKMKWKPVEQEIQNEVINIKRDVFSRRFIPIQDRAP